MTIDLRRRPPRSPRAELGGLKFLPRTIDKARAQLAETAGTYGMRGFSEQVLAALGITVPQFLDAVRDARDDDAVVAWLGAHADVSRYPAINEKLEAEAPIASDEDYRARTRRYPVMLRHPEVRDRLTILELDDAWQFENPDPASLVAIDTHVHAHADSFADEASGTAAKAYFKMPDVPIQLDELAAYYRERKMACVVFSVDEKLTGTPMVSNDDVLAAATRNPDVLIPFASVDPTQPGALEETQRLLAFGRFRGFKLHPPLMEFWPNDRAIYPFYEAIEAARLPLIFHTGHSGIGTGMRGGGGIRLKYGSPMPIDDVAVDFPDLPIVLAHPSFPWQDEAISIALHKPNVFIDLSGWSPKYFSPTLVQYANSLLRGKVLFASDYPLITPDRWIADFEKLPMKDEVKPLIMKENAVRLLGLGERDHAPATR